MTIALWAGFWLFAASAFTIIWLQNQELKDLRDWRRTVYCCCGAVPVLIPACVVKDGWHHCGTNPCRPLHEEVQP